jgi:hypothetical protein
MLAPEEMKRTIEVLRQRIAIIGDSL